MPCPTPLPSSEDPRHARREAALERLTLAGQELSPALVAQARSSLASAFALSDLLLGRR